MYSQVLQNHSYLNFKHWNQYHHHPAIKIGKIAIGRIKHARIRGRKQRTRVTQLPISFDIDNFRRGPELEDPKFMLNPLGIPIPLRTWDFFLIDENLPHAKISASSRTREEPKSKF